jgi:hypothetical protein
MALLRTSILFAITILFDDRDLIPLAVLDNQIFHHVADAAMVALCRFPQGFTDFRGDSQIEVGRFE